MSEIPEHSLKIIPLGGVEEIGLNMTVLEYGDDIIVVDAGLMFPDEEMHGVDYVIADTTYLRERKDNVRAILLTHGHEDHTGALPYVLRDITVPVYGTALTIGLVHSKLREHNLHESTEFIVVKPRDVVQLGPFRVEFIRVTHSIVDGVAMGIETPVGRVVHTGDFKLDPTPVDGELMDFHKFTEYGEKGTLALLSDSTNAERGGFTFSEKEVRRGLDHIFAAAPGRIIIATFASNIHRIQQIVDAAVMCNRKVALNGRSMITNTQIALDLGYLNIPGGTWLKLTDLDKLDDSEVVLITTGSQGEPMSALSRMAVDEHKQIKIKEGDTVILSAKVIPGNERAIGKVINHLFRRGAIVHYEKVSDIHVSGHASKEELKLMMNMVKPQYFIPVHGEYRHLVYHSMLAPKCGIPKENVFILQDGEPVEFLPDGTAQRLEKVTCGRVFIDGKGVGDVGDVVLRDRRRLASDGVILILLNMEKESGKIISGPDLVSRGFVYEDESRDLLDAARYELEYALMEMDSELKSDMAMLQTKLRSVLKKFIYKSIERTPMILPIVMEL
ncbi:MAG: ribonuclease J [Nitrospirae bacterium]|nr:ribonuclease J [Nitrospirota bacterium]